MNQKDYKEQAERYKKKHQIQTANNSRSLKMVLDKMIAKKQKTK